MNIAVIGAGRIGSAFAFHLARAGHELTVIARGSRLDALRGEGAIVALGGERAPVGVAAELNTTVPYDLVLVTVLSHQVDGLLPALRASAAKSVLFLFNTFDKIDRWRDALGAERFAAGFPNMLALFVDGKLRSVVDGPGMVTTLTSARWAAVLKQAGLPTEVEPDMNSYLRSHVAFAVPAMVAGLMTWKRNAGLTWAEAAKLTGAMLEGFALVRALGHSLKPGFVPLLAALPAFVLTAMTWCFSRTASVRDLGEFGPAESRALIDAMAAAAPGKTPKLLAIRP